MLDKATCRTCIETARRESSPFHEGWTSIDEVRWEKRKEVRCVVAKDVVNVDDDIPERCLYILDQMMLNDEDCA